MRNYITTIALVFAVALTSQAQTPETNYVKTTAYKVATTDGSNVADDDKIESISYFDGLGRPIQVIQVRGGGNRENIVQFHEYDDYGREVKTYLPYATTGQVTTDPLNLVIDPAAAQESYYLNNYGNDFTNGIINPFSEMEYEDSPLNRPFKQAAPGTDWSLGSGHEVRMDYQTNGTGDGIKKFSVIFNNYTTASPSNTSNELGKYEPTLTYEGLYGLGQLYKNIVKDENWTLNSGKDHTVEEFTDKSGRVILKRTYENNHPHDTYYVYDDYGNLSFVIPPLAADQIVTSTINFNTGLNQNLSWVNLVNVDREFADNHNNLLEDYDNSAILNLDLENEYGGIGGVTVTGYDNSDQLSVAINFSVNEPLELINGYIFNLEEYGEFEDGELGVINGNGYNYSFSIDKNQIFVSGEGELAGLNAVFTNQVNLSHSINYPWVDFVDIDEEERWNYHNAIEEQEIENAQLLTTVIANPYNGTGGMNVSIDANDNVSVSLNTSYNTSLEFLSGANIYLDIDRMLTDRDLGTITGNGYEYHLELKNNHILIAGEGSLTGRVDVFTVGRPVVEHSIDAPTLQSLGYIYEYDSLNRLIEKKIPGKDWEHIIYDYLDRPILTQDGNQRAVIGMSKQWLFTKYDKLGRVVYTGIYRSPLSRKQLQKDYQEFYDDPLNDEFDLYEIRRVAELSWNINDNNIYYTHRSFPNDTSLMSLLTVSYYDDPVIEIGDFDSFKYDVGNVDIADGLSYNDPQTYSQSAGVGTLNSIGLPTISEVRTLGTNKWTNSASYYDLKARPIYAISDNDYLNTVDKSWMDIDFIGKVLHTRTTHTKAGVQSLIDIEDSFTYDHVDRLLTHKQTIDNQPEELIVDNQYDALGLMISKKVGGTATGNGLQTVDYNYNIRGWLTDINPFDTDLGEDLFSFSLAYNSPTQSGATPLFNGNISQTSWRTASDNQDRSYYYEYDALNRINSATYIGSQLLAQNVGNNIAGEYEDYSLADVSYDKNGNILTLNRMGLYKEDPEALAYDAVDWVDKLVYNYSPKSNQLIDVIDSADSDDILNGGFEDKYTDGNNYSYGDLNGNMTQDLNKGIEHITYNYLNLPTVISFDHGGEIKYTYDATGVKLRKQVTSNDVSTFTYYAGNYIYEQDNNGEELKFFSHPEGFTEKNGNNFDYVYQYKDHLGNVRLNYAQDGTDLIIREENNYYPFGLKHKGYNNVITGRDHKYGYGGKEEQDELGLEWHDFHARNYDASLGRWMNVDPLAEKYPSMSPYSAFANNPIFYVDPDGREIKTHREVAEDGTVTIVVTVSGKLINNSSTSYTAEEMQGIADRIASSIAESYTGEGETVNWKGVANISVASDDNPLTETDHAFRLYDLSLIHI